MPLKSSSHWVDLNSLIFQKKLKSHKLQGLGSYIFSVLINIMSYASTRNSGSQCF